MIILLWNLNIETVSTCEMDIVLIVSSTTKSKTEPKKKCFNFNCAAYGSSGLKLLSNLGTQSVIRSLYHASIFYPRNLR